MSVVSLRGIVRNPTLRGSALSVLDQGVCSLSNFLTGVIVARALLPEAFGVYSLYFAGIMVLSGFQTALITGPTRVLGVRPTGVDAGNYFKTQVRLQLILSTTLVGGAAVGLFTLHPGDPLATGAFLLCLVLFQFQELTRVIYLTRMTLVSLLRLDITTHVLRIGLLLAAMRLGVLSPGVALLIIAAAYGAGVAIAGRNVLPHTTSASLGKMARANWRYGRWLLLEMVAYTGSTRVYLYLTALWVDTIAVGGLSAVLVLMNAVNVLVLGIINYAGPVARRRLLEGGYDVWRRWLVRIGVFLAAGVGTFGLLAFVFAEPLLTLIYGPTYAAFAHLIPIVALQVLLSACNTVLSVAFRTAELPQVGFAAKGVSAVATLLIAYPLLKAWGVTGAAVGLVVTQALWTTIYATYAARGALSRTQVVVAQTRS